MTAIGLLPDEDVNLRRTAVRKEEGPLALGVSCVGLEGEEDTGCREGEDRGSPAPGSP